MSEMTNTYLYVLDLRNHIEETCRLPSENLYKAQGEKKHHCDKKTKILQFKVRLKVLVLLPTEHTKLKDEVEAMLEADIIEPPKSAYCSQVTIVKKKLGSNRFCIDFRKLNLMTKFNAEPMEIPMTS